MGAEVVGILDHDEALGVSAGAEVVGILDHEEALGVSVGSEVVGILDNEEALGVSVGSEVVGILDHEEALGIPVGPEEGLIKGAGVDDTGSSDGFTDGLIVGVDVLDAKPVGFKHNPEFCAGCWHWR